MKFKLIACDKDDVKRSEFDGFEFEADSWEDAGKVFCGLAGQYGCPADEDYDMAEVEG